MGATQVAIPGRDCAAGPATIEYTLVCARDTPPRTRRAVATAALTARVAVPLLRKFA